MTAYFKQIFLVFHTLYKGLKLTLSHLRNANHRYAPIGVQNHNYFSQHNGLVTLTYPYESIPVPDHGRYKLHNEIDDCIVCDKCAVICPVQCIAIETIKSPEPIGITSDGSVKRLYASTFDIDMAKCCFCGLCTSVCPTECLTMTNEYDFSVKDIREMNFSFTDLSPEQAIEKKKLYEQYMLEKEAFKKEQSEKSESTTPQVPKPAFKPVIKTSNIVKNETNENSIAEEPAKTAAPKPVFKPIIKPSTIVKTVNEEEEVKSVPKPTGIKPVIKPVFKKPNPDGN
ncbi:MAG: 4Fe-4S dicluster domain-containing protein [Bacteroidota bacterium]|nr:4Fe-4S dicluster domain-containing protein [Bacteroidota bacterium]